MAVLVQSGSFLIVLPLVWTSSSSKHTRSPTFLFNQFTVWTNDTVHSLWRGFGPLQTPPIIMQSEECRQAANSTHKLSEVESHLFDSTCYPSNHMKNGHQGLSFTNPHGRHDSWNTAMINSFWDGHNPTDTKVYNLQTSSEMLHAFNTIWSKYFKATS